MTPLHCESSLLNSVFCSFCAFVCDPEKDKEDQAVTGDNGQSPLMEFFMILLEWQVFQNCLNTAQF